MALLTVENLTFTYPAAAAPALQNVSFSLEAGSFTVMAGATGSGKSTLLRLLKKELAPLGQLSGSITLNGADPATVPAARVGYVAQQPQQQIVTDKVWHELAFGLENMGLPKKEIGRRVAEMAAYFGIEAWYDRPVAELSGGQQQLLNLAAVMVMQPDLLLLDEPTAQLDPIAASDFMATVYKINREFGLTVLLAEHRLEEAVPLCDRLLVLENGALPVNAPPAQAAAALADRPELLCAMPSAVRLYHAVGGQGPCPLSVRQGRQFVTTHFGNAVRSLPVPPAVHSEQPALTLQNVRLRYQRHLPDVLQGTDLTVYEGELFCLLGGNGSGKSTLLAAAAGLVQPYMGRIDVLGKPIKQYKNQSLYRNGVALLPQDVQTVFLRNTVAEELADVDLAAEELPFDLSPLYDRHPYDLSGGEQQLVALAKVLAARPKLLLLDEPTKGLDAYTKQRFIGVLRQLQGQGVTVVAVTHDVAFACACADRCGLLFRGQVVSVGVPAEFFAQNAFYTTAASRITRGYYDGAVTVEAAARLCLLNAPGKEPTA